MDLMDVNLPQAIAEGFGMLEDVIVSYMHCFVILESPHDILAPRKKIQHLKNTRQKYEIFAKNLGFNCVCS